jgi:DNA-binding GntR family transcriptional regulator
VRKIDVGKRYAMGSFVALMTSEALVDEREAALAELAEPADMAKLLGEDIIFGRLAPGARLTEGNLIARFNVTRHFVRQALVELERTGIVVREKNKGVSVRSLSPREVSQI